ncbi:MAG TPA: amidohydrolase family protein [Candidatus Angelobacter sp.]|nr:amidohydrolase family protein [Candidatus Angelobacter sp.]
MQQKTAMRVVALEEHFSLPELVQEIDPRRIASRGWPRPDERPPEMAHIEELKEVGANRIAGMDEAGVTVQVLSVSGPGADLLPPEKGPQFARSYNDWLKQAIGKYPGRFAGFAHLPMTAPEAAADELERCVRELGFCGALINGLTDNRFLDDPFFGPILARAEALDVPIHLHPNVPPEAVRNSYFAGLPGPTGFLLSSPGWGWHAETAVHILRMVLAGTLEKYPRLKIIIGHMGEGLPAMLTRVDNIFTQTTSSYLKRTVSQTILDQVWITTSGFFSLPPFLAALTSFGVDRILFSVDYPFSQNHVAMKFLADLPVSPADREKIAHGNADRLLKLQPA